MRFTGTITPYCTLTFAHESYIHCTITKVKFDRHCTTLLWWNRRRRGKKVQLLRTFNYVFLMLWHKPIHQNMRAFNWNTCMPKNTFFTEGTKVGFVKPSPSMSINLPIILIIYVRYTGTITPYSTLTIAHGSYVHYTFAKVKFDRDCATLSR